MIRLPIGDVIMYGVYKNDHNQEPLYVYSPSNNYTHIAESQLWWVDLKDLEELRDLCKDWEDNGFTLGVGVAGRGSQDIPEVIEYEWQERRHGNRWVVSTRGDVALVDYVLVWLEINDTEKAYDYMTTHTDIPVAVRCDLNEYSNNDRYKQVFDIANNYFIYYFSNGRPKDVQDNLNEEDFYDV
jgi:hypothetical protein